ncbi:MAG: hypothetical protein LAO20_04340 [Acidobacteriia bacterium]|nr:hypothetical protein [Terriglobia bacterium]
MATIMSGTCSICDELIGTAPNRLSPLLSGSVNAILHETETLALIPSVGALVIGHCLIVPKWHSCNVMLSLESSGMQELFSILASVQQLASDRLGVTGLFCFEHGKHNMDEGDVLCSTSHGHLHVLPLRKRQIDRVFERASMDLQSDLPLNLLREKVDKFDEYIAAFVWQRGRSCQRTAVLNAKGLPSQYLRKVIAESVGVAEWNWKRDPRVDIVKKTIDELCIQVPVFPSTAQ